MLIHVPRTLWTLCRGFLQPQPGVGVGRPHIYRARVNAFTDIDQFLHMNNAAYAVHFEMARWELGASSGMVTELLRRKGQFVVASMAIRFRKELRPLQSFEIHSELVAADQRQMWIKQIIREPGSERPLAGGVCRAVLRQGRESISPTEVFRAAGGDPASLATLADGSAPCTEFEALSVLERSLSG